MMKGLFFFTILLIISFQIALSQEYRAVPLIHPAGNLFVSGLNNQGQVCGTVLVDDVNFINNAVRFEPDGTFKTLALGDIGQSSTASSINDFGHVLGTISRTDFTTAIVIWETDSTFRELEQPDGFASVLPQDLNNQGEAVGYIFNFGGANEAVFWDADGVLEELPQPEGGAEAQVLNDSSEIAGKIYNADSTITLVVWEPLDTADARSSHQYDFPATLGGAATKGDFFFFNNNGLKGGSLDGRAILHNDETGLTDLGPGELDSGNRWGDWSGFIDGSFGPQPRVSIGDTEAGPQQLNENMIFAGLINDRLMLHGTDISSGDYLLIPNFNYKIDASAAEDQQLQIFTDFNQTVVNQLDAAYPDIPSIFPLTLEVCSGQYASDSWNFSNKWSFNVGLRVEDMTFIDEVSVGEGIEWIEIEPRVGLEYPLSEERPKVNFNSFLNGADQTIVDVNLEGTDFIFQSTDASEIQTRNPAKVFMENLQMNGIRLDIYGRLSTRNMEISSGTIGTSTEESGSTIENPNFDKFAFDGNIPLRGSPFSVTDENNFAEGRIERVAPLSNPWSIPEPDCGFYFGLGLDGEPAPVIMQPAEAGIGASETVISAEVIDIASSPLDPSTSFMQDNFVTEIISPRVFRVGVRLRFNRRDLESIPIATNIRIPLYREEVDDPTLYRLLMFDCEGNLLGIAGDFLAPTLDPASSIAYTGFIDGVFNLTHANVMLDSCQYLAVATGMMTTSVSEKAGWDQGFRFRNIYPNPSADNAHLAISIPRTSEVGVTLIDVMGRTVWTKNEERVVEGNHTIDIDDLTLIPGIYYCQIEFSDPYRSDFHYMQSKKLIVID